MKQLLYYYISLEKKNIKHDKFYHIKKTFFLFFYYGFICICGKIEIERKKNIDNINFNNNQNE